jgi:hypothetical protein
MVAGKDTAEDALTRADHGMYARKAERRASQAMMSGVS